MKTLTLFNAYVKVRDRQETLVNLRGWRLGILSDKDDYALQYQRLDRFARKIEARFNGDGTCYSCAGANDWHYSFCRRNNE